MKSRTCFVEPGLRPAHRLREAFVLANAPPSGANQVRLEGAIRQRFVRRHWSAASHAVVEAQDADEPRGRIAALKEQHSLRVQ